MPIYSYLCSSCGFSKDILQKLSDKPISICPECHKSSFEKQLTAAGFVLKGSGWYVTDFKDQKKKDKKNKETQKNDHVKDKLEVKSKNDTDNKKNDVNKKKEVKTSLNQSKTKMGENHAKK